MSDRLAVMSSGRIEQVGTPREVYYRPATPFVASFIGKTNLLAGTVRASDGARRRARCAGLAIPLADGPPDGAVHVLPALRVRPCGRRRRADDDLALDAIVEEVVFLGDSSEVICRVGGTRLMLAGRPTQRSGESGVGDQVTPLVPPGRRGARRWLARPRCQHSGRPGRARWLRAWRLAPLAVWVVVLVAVPNLLLLVYSLWESENGRTHPDGLAWQLRGHRHLRGGTQTCCFAPCSPPWARRCSRR